MKYLHQKQNYKTRNLEENNLGILTMKPIEGTHKQRTKNEKKIQSYLAEIRQEVDDENKPYRNEGHIRS